ncbi:MAG: M20/M25/M40 family metallo-hydrolase [Cyclobacteriaceae bacterium]
MHKLAILPLVCIFLIIYQNGVSQNHDHDSFQEYAQSSFSDFKDLLSLPNDALFPNDIEENVKWCEENFSKRGFTHTRLETPGAPLLLAEKKTSIKRAKTVLVYLQIDGQPVDTSYWLQKSPYEPVLKQAKSNGSWEQIDWNLLEEEDINPDWRIFARSASDAKGPVLMFLTAMDMMISEGKNPNFNLKVIMDFEEEMGSPNLPEAVGQYGEHLAADMLVIFDGPLHITNKPTLTFGARGISTITLTTFGAIAPQHSGHYGNYLPNPAIRLSRLIASMKDDHGRVTIPGFYDGINISDPVKEVLRAVPDDESFINAKLGIFSPDSVAPNYQESLQYPSLNVRGLSSGWVGTASRTIVPANATAEIDIRLVIESDPERLLGLVRGHILSQGYHITDRSPTTEERAAYERICQFNSETSYLAFRTDFDSEVGIWLDKALTKAHGAPPIKQRTSGGSIPISPFVNQLGIPAVTVPTVNRDNNQHSPNENIRIGNYIDGIKTIYAILLEPLK